MFDLTESILLHAREQQRASALKKKLTGRKQRSDPDSHWKNADLSQYPPVPKTASPKDVLTTELNKRQAELNKWMSPT